MDYSIAICLATYNGERYLAEQLDSLLSQDYKNIKVYIHDDGSADGTEDIVRQYVDKYPEILVFFDDDISYRNCGLNFIETLKRVPKHDFYMFCDQDDVWLDNKISQTLNAVLKETDDIDGFPILAYTDVSLVDSRLNALHNRLYDQTGFNEIYTNYESSALGGTAFGCTMLFNDYSKNQLFKYRYPKGDEKMCHDYWLSLCTLVHDNSMLIYLNDTTILYRQHENNVYGFKLRYKSKNFPLIKTIFCAVNIFSIIKIYKNIKRMNMYLPRTILFFNAYVISIKMKYKKYKWRYKSKR